MALVAGSSGAIASDPEAVRDSDFRDGGKPQTAKVELGRVLMFDKILSGNRNISCATCHHPFAKTSDGLSLPVGEGGMGISVTRDTGANNDAIIERVPRNSPSLFNLGAFEFGTLFHDGRVAESDDGFISPAGDDLPEGLDNVLAVQAMFPVTSATEMAGQPEENEIGKAAAASDFPTIWEQLAKRLQDIPEYARLFFDAFGIAQSEITYVHAANAIAAFEAAAWRNDKSPFDQYLAGNERAMSKSAIRGMKLFYGEAGCSKCHSGHFQTDHDFHAIAMPQIGPGKGDGPSGREDFGRGRETGLSEDRFKFRTPSLRNIALTAPYGHSGAYAKLEDVVRHHLDPITALNNYDSSQAVLPNRKDLNSIDFFVMNNNDLVADIAGANELAPFQANDEEVDNLIAFLHALTDPNSLDLGKDVPARVPSGLPVFD